MASYMTPQEFSADPNNIEVWGNYESYLQQWGAQVMGGQPAGAPTSLANAADAATGERPAGPDYAAWAKGTFNGNPLEGASRGHYDNWLREYNRAGTTGRDQLFKSHGLNDWHAEAGIAPVNGGYGGRGATAGVGRPRSLHDRALARDGMRSGSDMLYNSGNMGYGGGGYGPGGSGGLFGRDSRGNYGYGGAAVSEADDPNGERGIGGMGGPMGPDSGPGARGAQGGRPY